MPLTRQDRFRVIRRDPIRSGVGRTSPGPQAGDGLFL
jgi:hypothetical protein